MCVFIHLTPFNSSLTLQHKVSELTCHRVLMDRISLTDCKNTTQTKYKTRENRIICFLAGDNDYFYKNGEQIRYHKISVKEL